MKNNFSNIEEALKAEAEKNIPEFNEDAWRKMEALLDEDERRPKLIFWFSGIALLLLLLTGLYFMNRNTEPDKISDKTIAHTETGQEKKPETTGTVSETNDKTKEKDSVGGHFTARPNSTNIIKNELPFQDQRVFIKPSIKNSHSDKPGLFANSLQGNNVQSGDDKRIEPENNMPAGTPAIEVQKPVADSPSTTSSVAEPKPELPPADSVKDDTKETRIKKNRFYLTGMIGLGTDKTTLGNASRLTPKYGLGAGFVINNKWSVGISIRAHRKIYTAGPDDYKVKSGYWSVVDIQEVEADCMVYEIPVTVNYNLFEKNNYRFFVSAGMSSFIMKKEKYDFSYINTSGQPAKGSSAYSGNKHFFSAVNLGLGVSKKLNKRLQIFAAPSVSLPVNGIGEGGIKLKSFEISAGVNYFLFR